MLFLIPFTKSSRSLRRRFTLTRYRTRWTLLAEETGLILGQSEGDLRAAEGYAKVSSKNIQTEPPNGQTRSNPGTQSRGATSVVGWAAEEEAHARASASVRPRTVFLRIPSQQCAMLQRLCTLTHAFVFSLDGRHAARRRSGRAFVLRMNPCASSK